MTNQYLNIQLSIFIWFKIGTHTKLLSKAERACKQLISWRLPFSYSTLNQMLSNRRQRCHPGTSFYSSPSYTDPISSLIIICLFLLLSFCWSTPQSTLLRTGTCEINLMGTCLKKKVYILLSYIFLHAQQQPAYWNPV